jgi:hypothetical protein
MASVGIAFGQTGAFAVMQDYGLQPDGEMYVCDTVASRGMFVYESAEGVVSIVSGNMAATARLVGFIEQNVVADNSQAIEFGYAAQQKTSTEAGDKVVVWQAGRFFVTAVSGSISAGADIYPGDGGKVQGVQVGSAPKIGVCRKGNSTAGDPIEVEAWLIGRKAV